MEETTRGSHCFICVMKTSAYAGRDKIRDLYDVTFICNNFIDRLSPPTVALIRSAVEHKGIAQFDYVVRDQPDELIDNDKLAADFLMMYDCLGLLSEEDERNLLDNSYDSETCHDVEDGDDGLEQ